MTYWDHQSEETGNTRGANAYWRSSNLVPATTRTAPEYLGLWWIQLQPDGPQPQGFFVVPAGILSERTLDVTRLKEATDLLSSARARQSDSWSHLSAADDWQRTVAKVSVRALAVEESACNRRRQRGGRKCTWTYHTLPLKYEGQVGASRAVCRQYSMLVNSVARRQLAPTVLRLLNRPSCDHHRLGLLRLVTDQLQKRVRRRNHATKTRTQPRMTAKQYSATGVLLRWTSFATDWLLPAAYNGNRKNTSTAKWKIQKQNITHLTGLFYLQGLRSSV